MNIAFYTYGDHQMGMGHIYRSMTLINAFKKRAKAVPSILFLSRDYKEGIKKLQESGYQVYKIPTGIPEHQEIEFCSRAFSDFSPDVFIADALQISPAMTSLFKANSNYLVSLDDIGDGRLMADLAVNVLYHSKKKDNKILELEDFKYLILREECSAANRQEAIIKQDIKRILVTQGGSDTYGITLKITKALESVDSNIEIILLLGPAFKHEKELKELVQSLKRGYTIKKDVRDVIGLFSQCDLAITGAGITLFELAAVGVPCIVLTQEHKEIETANRVENAGFAQNLGLSENLSEEEIFHLVNQLIKDYALRKKLSEKSKKEVDGLGADRIVDIILNALAQKN